MEVSVTRMVRFSVASSALCIVAATALGACQQTGASTAALNDDAARTSAEAPATQVQVQEAAYGLHLVSMGDRAKLAYGYPDSDAVRLMLECDAGSGRVDVSDIAGTDTADRLTLTSGGESSALPGVIEPGAHPVIYAASDADVAPLRAFRDNGRLMVETGAEPYEIVASNQERAQVRAFFDTCAAEA